MLTRSHLEEAYAFRDMLRIDLADGARLRLKPSAEDIDLDARRFSQIRVLVTVAKAGEHMLVTLEARAAAVLLCDRTLGEFKQPIQGTYRMLLASKGEGMPPGDFDEGILLKASQRTIDVACAARDTLMLAVPTRKVAPHAEDIEIQTVFGAPESSTDRRWEALRSLSADIDP